MKVIVHVNQHVIKHNSKHGTSYPVLTCKVPPSAGLTDPAGFKLPVLIYCHEVEGYGRVIDSNARSRNGLSCGARVWMEYDAETFAVQGPWIDWPTLRDRLRAAHDEQAEDTTGLRMALSPEAE